MAEAPITRPVELPSGKVVNIQLRRGHVLVCALGNACGNSERGYAPVLANLYKAERERRGLKFDLHVSLTDCLGPCSVGNVVMLTFDGETHCFRSMDGEEQVLQLFDYVESMRAAGVYHEPPEPLATLRFTRFHSELRSEDPEVG